MTLNDVSRVLDLYPVDERPIRALEPLGGAGGLSGSRLWRFASANGARVIRAWPSQTPGLDRVLRVHRWLRTANDLRFIPQPIASAAGSTAVELFGRAWQLDPWLAGSPDLGPRPAVERIRSVYRALAEFHLRLSRIDDSRGASPGLSGRREELRRLASGGFDAIGASILASPDDPCAEAALEWLATARTLAPHVVASTGGHPVDLPLQPCLRDARPEHFLITGDSVTGLIDFGAMDVETVGADIARLTGEWLPRGATGPLRAAGMDAYRSVRRLEPSEEQASAAFERLADILVGERWVRWRFVEGRRFDDGRAFTLGIGRGLARVRRLASEVGAGI